MKVTGILGFGTVAVLSGFLLSLGCSSSTGPEKEDKCPQTYEFGNHGCARIVAVLEVIPDPWPTLYRWSIRANPADTSLRVSAMNNDPVEGAVLLTLTQFLIPLPYDGDTASVWVTAKLLEDPRPIQTGVPLPVFASDSVLHLARFSEVGEVPAVDTVFLRLVRPEGGGLHP